MAKLSGEQYAEKWGRRLKGSVQDIQDGINRVTVNPTQLAAAKQDKMLQNLTKAVQEGKWKAGLGRVSLEEWKSKALEKGVQRIAMGADAAAGKMAQFGAQLLAFQDSLQTKIQSLPDLTLEDSINRMTTWTRGMAKFQRK